MSIEFFYNLINSINQSYAEKKKELEGKLKFAADVLASVDGFCQALQERGLADECEARLCPDRLYRVGFRVKGTDTWVAAMVNVDEPDGLGPPREYTRSVSVGSGEDFEAVKGAFINQFRPRLHAKDMHETLSEMGRLLNKIRLEFAIEDESLATR